MFHFLLLSILRSKSSSKWKMSPSKLELLSRWRNRIGIKKWVKSDHKTKHTRKINLLGPYVVNFHRYRKRSFELRKTPVQTSIAFSRQTAKLQVSWAKDCLQRTKTSCSYSMAFSQPRKGHAWIPGVVLVRALQKCYCMESGVGDRCILHASDPR